MDKIETEQMIRLFTEIQTCKDKRHAFIKGVLYGLGFNANIPEPNWLIIQDLISRGKDDCNWIDIEKSVLDIYKKVLNEHIKLWQSMIDNLYS